MYENHSSSLKAASISAMSDDCNGIVIPQQQTTTTQQKTWQPARKKQQKQQQRKHQKQEQKQKHPPPLIIIVWCTTSRKFRPSSFSGKQGGQPHSPTPPHWSFRIPPKYLTTPCSTHPQSRRFSLFDFISQPFFLLITMPPVCQSSSCYRSNYHAIPDVNKPPIVKLNKNIYGQ